MANLLSTYHLACLWVPPEQCARYDLLMGRWPGTAELLPADVQYPWTWLRLVRRAELRHVPELRIWLEHFPELEAGVRGDEAEAVAELLRGVLASCHVRSLHYGFGPSPTPENLRLQGEASDLRNTELGLAFQSALESAQDEHGMLYAEYWPVDSPVGDVVEAQVGLLGAVRQGASFREASPSLVVGLLVRSGERLDDLTPAQLEELVSALLQCEGWTVEHTPATRDGGKDLIARRDDDNRAMVYVEVKHLKKSKVNVGQVREFVAVMGGDGIDRGYLVTSSAFTRDALAWARERGKRIAVLEPIDGESLRQRLEAAASGIRSVIPKIPASATTRRERTVAQTRASKPAEYTGSSPPAEDR